jgi:RimJ/RimL family protein N-acetyltransferase
MTLVLRRAEETDAERLLAWRNDPETRANSRRQHILTWAELIEAAPGTQRETYVGEIDGNPVGSVRLDYTGQDCELSWTVAPESRGHGIGRALVAAAIAQARTNMLIAAIKPDNLASRRIAEALGFTQYGEEQGLEVWRLQCGSTAG